MYATTAQIHTLRRKEGGALGYEPNSSQVIQTDFDVWRVAWNATGTVLLTSCEGALGLWRRDVSTGAWVNVHFQKGSSRESVTFLHGSR